LILPAWHGIDKIKDMGDLAALGYYSFIADIYGELPEDNAEAGQKSSYYKTNYKEYQKKNFIRSINQAGANPDNIVVIGYCFGGTGLEAARGHINVKGFLSMVA
jgi:dienelactone hydrolase